LADVKGQNVTARGEMAKEIGILEIYMAELIKMEIDIEGRRRETIHIRLEFMACFAHLASIAEKLYTSADQLKIFRRKHSEARSAIATHQANWPVVAIDMKNPKCASSAKHSRDATREVIKRVRHTIV
jgi:hypothetical protein